MVETVCVGLKRRQLEPSQVEQDKQSMGLHEFIFVTLMIISILVPGRYLVVIRGSVHNLKTTDAIRSNVESVDLYLHHAIAA